ncbi:hypothetical protein BJY00DRAFT_312277 [Aspergillus carlsbadensis]|nr:hypothetical protein BJY00DRAFT_312277 [Aspergillus carlsbadensis]
MSESEIRTLKDLTTAGALAKQTLLTLFALQNALAACPPRIRAAYDDPALENACSRWLQVCAVLMGAESKCAASQSQSPRKFELLWACVEDVHRCLAQCLDVAERVAGGSRRGSSLQNNCNDFTDSHCRTNPSHSPSPSSTRGVLVEEGIRVLTMNSRVIPARIRAVEAMVKKYT